jgi:Na+/H+-translocating membrane pyrophosphatase
MLNQASMANQDAQMRDRLAALGMLESSMGRAYGIGSAGMGALIPATLGYWQQRNDNKQAQNGMWGKVLGGMASMGTLLLQDKMRNQNPDGMGSGTPYEPNPYG